EKAAGIKVGATFARLCILQATHWDVTKGTLVGSYTVHYVDNSHETIPIVFGKDVRNWWYSEGAKEPGRAVAAWHGENDEAWRCNRKLRLYLSIWKNPYPARKVASIDFASTNAGVAPFCVAMTIEE